HENSSNLIFIPKKIIFLLDGKKGSQNEKFITTLVLTLFFTGCSNSPKILYSPDPAKELTQVKILPGYGQRTWSSVCLNKEWQGLHEQPLSNDILGFDSSNFSRSHLKNA